METRLPSRAAQSQLHRKHLCRPPATGRWPSVTTDGILCHDWTLHYGTGLLSISILKACCSLLEAGVVLRGRGKNSITEFQPHGYKVWGAGSDGSCCMLSEGTRGPQEFTCYDHPLSSKSGELL